MTTLDGVQLFEKIEEAIGNGFLLDGDVESAQLRGDLRMWMIGPDRFAGSRTCPSFIGHENEIPRVVIAA
ncbi:hypothetical protein ASG39_01145 [Rhizobium sp. Leaf371]|nr:hypothetical protein ASG39_01145 [Rhizobium sp. Leaf371]